MELDINVFRKKDYFENYGNEKFNISLSTSNKSIDILVDEVKNAIDKFDNIKKDITSISKSKEFLTIINSPFYKDKIYDSVQCLWKSIDFFSYVKDTSDIDSNSLIKIKNRLINKNIKVRKPFVDTRTVDTVTKTIEDINERLKDIYDKLDKLSKDTNISKTISEILPTIGKAILCVVLLLVFAYGTWKFIISPLLINNTSEKREEDREVLTNLLKRISEDGNLYYSIRHGLSAIQSNKYYFCIDKYKSAKYSALLNVNGSTKEFIKIDYNQESSVTGTRWKKTISETSRVYKDIQMDIYSLDIDKLVNREYSRRFINFTLSPMEGYDGIVILEFRTNRVRDIDIHRCLTLNTSNVFIDVYINVINRGQENMIKVEVAEEGFFDKFKPTKKENKNKNNVDLLPPEEIKKSLDFVKSVSVLIASRISKYSLLKKAFVSDIHTVNVQAFAVGKDKYCTICHCDIHKVFTENELEDYDETDDKNPVAKYYIELDKFVAEFEKFIVKVNNDKQFGNFVVDYNKDYEYFGVTVERK